MAIQYIRYGAKGMRGAYIGYPQYALEKDGKIRLSVLEETIKIMEVE